MSDKKGKGSGTKDACYHKVKSRYSVWPSAYASGALSKCRKVGAANWGNKRADEVYARMAQAYLVEKDENNPWAICTASVGREDKEKYERCVKSVKRQDEGKGKMPSNFSVKSGDKSAAGGLTAKGVARYRRANPGSKLKTAVTTKPSKLKKGGKRSKRRKSFCARMGGMKKRLTSSKTANDPNSRINKALRKWNC